MEVIRNRLKRLQKENCLGFVQWFTNNFPYSEIVLFCFRTWYEFWWLLSDQEVYLRIYSKFTEKWMRWPFSGENEIVVPTVNLRTVNMARMYECYLNIKPCFILTMILITSDYCLNYYLESTVHCINYSLLCVVRTAIFTIFGDVFIVQKL